MILKTRNPNHKVLYQIYIHYEYVWFFNVFIQHFQHIVLAGLCTRCVAEIKWFHSGNLFG